MFRAPFHLVLATLTPVVGLSQTFTNGDWVYRLNASNEAMITGYLGVAENVVIPEELGGFVVRQIGNGRPSIFGWTNYTVRNVVIPGTVNFLGSLAFANARGLTNLHIPASVTNIGPWAISGCWSLPGISVDQSSQHFVSLEGVLFNKAQTTLVAYPAGKSGTYVVPPSVVTISNTAFANTIGITSVVVGSNVLQLGYSVFYGCENLTSVLFTGPPPMGGDNLFFASTPAVYYLPAQDDWPESFYGRPTAGFWPAAQHAAFDVGAFFSIFWTGTGSIPMSVRRAISLDGPWTVVSSNNATGQFTDLNPPSGKAFYQAYLP